MRVLHVIRTLDPSHGGPPMVVTRLGAAQAALGHEVTILSYAHPQSDAQVKKALAPIPDIGRVRLCYLDATSRFEIKAAMKVRPHVEEYVSKTDVVHLHGVWVPLLKMTAGLARQRGVPYFVRPCGVLDPWCLNQKRWKKRVAMWCGYRGMLCKAAGIHALNADETRFVGALKFGNHIETMPNGVFLSELEPLPAAGTFHAMHPELGGQPFILFLSRVHHKKGLDFLAEAFALVAPKHRSVRLVVAGPDEGAREDFERRIARAGLAERVHVVGPKYGTEKIAALVDATCFCLPSRQEGFSMAITESIACGTPVVISEDCHFPEVAQAGAGEVVPLNAQAVAAALDRMLCDEKRRLEMGRAGRELARSRYTWPAIATQCMAMYESHCPQATSKGLKDGVAF